MIENRIQALSGIERIGVHYHGLVMIPRSVMEQGGFYYRVRDLIIQTRGGKTITPIDSRSSHPSPFENVPVIGRPPAVMPRPILYRHPLAVDVPEDEDGNDWSGYCILFSPQSGTIPSYLWDVCVLAYTPDSQGQALAFSNKSYYRKLLIAPDGHSPTRGEYVFGYESTMRIVGATLDGRTRMTGQFPKIADIYTAYTWGDPQDPGFQGPRIDIYSLSGEHGSVTGTAQQSPLAPYGHNTESDRDVGERIRMVRVPVLWSEGACAPPDVAMKVEIDTYVDYMRPDWSEDFVTAYSAIDVCGDPLDPKFLICTLERHSAETNSDHGDGGGEYVLGGACGFSGTDRIVTGMTTWLEGGDTRAWSSTNSIKLSGYGATSKAQIVNEGSGTSSYRREAVSWETTTDTSSYTEDGSMTLTLDGESLMSISRWPALKSGQVSMPPLPKAAQGMDSSVYLYGQHTDSQPAEISAGTKVVSVAIGVINFSAEGIHALACVSREFVMASIGSYDPASVVTRMWVGRVFGFGTSKPGRELTSEEMNSKLYMAYDPVKNELSDIYDHPIFYQ